MNYLRNGHPLKALQQRCSFCRTQTDQKSFAFPFSFQTHCKNQGEAPVGVNFCMSHKGIDGICITCNSFYIIWKKERTT